MHSLQLWSPDVWDQGVRMVRFWWSSVIGVGRGLHCVLTWRKGWGGLLGVCFIRALIPFMGSLLSWPHHLLKAPPPHTITVGVRFQHVNFQGGHQHPAQNNHNLYGSIYKKHPEQANPETGSRWVVPGTGGGEGQGQWEDLNKPCTLGCSGISQFWLHNCWNCVFDSCSVTFVTIITFNGLPGRILPLCLAAKLKCLCSEPCPPVDGRKGEINISPAWGLPFYQILARLMAFLVCFFSSSFSSL